MKYGEKLRQRSIPAWSAYNIDYDDIKRFIKERTTTSERKNSTTKPSYTDDALQQLEDDLFAILEEQHRRIDLFVKSKAREIQHRVNDSKKRLRHLAARGHAGEEDKNNGNAGVNTTRISASKLERYSRLESDVLKAGNEIRSLARFIGAQRTGFGKLLKKNKKWTGSIRLEDRFREEVLSDPKSFTKYDIGPLLDDYSDTLHNVRALYSNRLQQTTAGAEGRTEQASYLIGSSIVEQLYTSLSTKRRTDFDTAVATVPLGENGVHASYFVHPENVVELQVSLIQYMDYHLLRSRQNSQVGPVTLQDVEQSLGGNVDEADYYWLGADNPERFAAEQRTLNAADLEARPGTTPQRSRISARWNTDQEENDALIAARVGETHVQVSKLRKKHVKTYFDKSNALSGRRVSTTTDGQLKEVDELCAPYSRDGTSQPLYLMSCHRSRFVGLSNSTRHVLIATLDTGISLQAYGDDSTRVKFPYAVLIVRQEGPASTAVFDMLEHNHLVERVRGFSMEYHAIWQVCKSAELSTPFWNTLLSQDIRKLPPPALKHSDTSGTSQTNGGESRSAFGGTNGSTTAVETPGESGLFASDLEQPPLRAFRKKRKRAFPQQLIAAPQERYWSEYDHPEDGDDADGSYVIYVDPDEKSTFDRMVESVTAIFRRKKAQDEESLLHTPATPPRDEESSSDEEPAVRTSSRRHMSYGATSSQNRQAQPRSGAPEAALFLPQSTIVCMIASAVILVIGFVLSATGRHRFGSTVHAGVLFALATSILFIIAGVVTLAGSKPVQRIALATAVATTLIESVAAGGLLAKLVG